MTGWGSDRTAYEMETDDGEDENSLSDEIYNQIDEEGSPLVIDKEDVKAFIEEVKTKIVMCSPFKRRNLIKLQKLAGDKLI